MVDLCAPTLSRPKQISDSQHIFTRIVCFRYNAATFHTLKGVKASQDITFPDCLLPVSFSYGTQQVQSQSCVITVTCSKFKGHVAS